MEGDEIVFLEDDEEMYPDNPASLAFIEKNP